MKTAFLSALLALISVSSFATPHYTVAIKTKSHTGSFAWYDRVTQVVHDGRMTSLHAKWLAREAEPPLHVGRSTRPVRSPWSSHPLGFNGSMLKVWFLPLNSHTLRVSCYTSDSDCSVISVDVIALEKAKKRIRH